MNFTIRRARELDITAINEELYPHLHNDHTCSQGHIRAVIRSSDYVLLVVDVGTVDAPKLVGAATLHLITQASRGRKGYIDDLVVIPSEREKGYGRKLFECLEEYARCQGATQIFYTSAPWRGAANEFHLALGYTLRARAVKKNGTNYYEKKLA